MKQEFQEEEIKESRQPQFQASMNGEMESGPQQSAKKKKKKKKKTEDMMNKINE
jgi:hypothetical protein